MAISAGEIEILLRARDEMSRVLDRANESIQRTGQAAQGSAQSTNVLQSSFTRLAAAFSVGNLIDRAVSALGSWAAEGIRAAGITVDLADSTGLSVETIQRMAFVANQTRGSVENFANAAFQLGIRIAGGGPSVVRALEDLGIAYDHIRAQSPDRMFEMTIGALERERDTTERNRQGKILFGNTWQTISTAVVQNYGRIASGASVSSRQQLEAVDDIADAWQAFSDNFSNSIARQIGAALAAVQAPAQRMIDRFNEGRRSGDDLKDATERLARTQGDLLTNGLAPLNTGLGAFTTQIDVGSLAGTRYRERLDAVKRSVYDLTPATRGEIAAAIELGVETERLVTEFSASAEVIERVKVVEEEATRAREEAGRQTEQATRAMRDLTREIEGGVRIGETFNQRLEEFGPKALEAAEGARRLGVGVSSAVAEMANSQRLREWGDLWERLWLEAAAGSSASLGQMTTHLEAHSRRRVELILATNTVETESRQRIVGLTQTAEEQKLSFAIAAATRHGANARQLADLERQLSITKRDGAIADAAREFVERGRYLDIGTEQGRQAYATLAAEHHLITTSIVNTWREGEEARAHAVREGAIQAMREGLQQLAQGFTQLAQLSDGSLGQIASGIGRVIAGLHTWMTAVESTNRGMNDLTSGNIVQGIANMATGILGMIGTVAGLFRGWFGVSEEVRRARAEVQQFENQLIASLTPQQRVEAAGRRWAEVVISVRDAYIATGRSAAEAEAIVRQLWDTDHPDRARAAIEQINQVLREQQEDQDRLNAAMERYGITWEELGATARNAHLQEIAEGLIYDFTVLIGAGADINLVIERMGDSINDFVASALRTGSEIPEAMRPMLERMIEMGLLTDENGEKLTDLSRVNWSQTMTQGFDRIVDRLDQLLRALGISLPGTFEDAADAADDFVDRIRRRLDEIPDEIIIDFTGRDNLNLDGGGSGGGDSQAGFATGTHGRLIDFGAGTRVTLHGRERVQTEAEVMAGVAADAGMVSALNRIEDAIVRQLPGILSRTVGTAVAQSMATRR